MTDQRKAARYGYLLVATLVLTSFLPLALGLSCAGIFYPYVAEDLGVGVGMMSYYTSFIMLSSTIFLSLMGRMLQRMDARIVLSLAVVVIAVVFVWLSFAASLWQFYVGAFTMGLGIGMLLFLAPSTLINRWFSKRAGFLLGIVMAFTGIGGVVWSAVGGSLILAIGWQNTYLVFAALSAVTLFATIFLVRNRPEDMGLLPVGSDSEPVTNEALEKAEAQGIPAAKAFKMPVFYLIFAMVFLLNFGMYLYFMIPSYLMGMELAVVMPLIGSMASSVAMAGQTISKLVFGFVGDRHPHLCTIVGLGLGVVGVVLLASGIENVALIFVAALTFGAYYGVTNVMSPILTRFNFGDVEYPKIYSRISTGAAIANVVAAFFWGAIIDATGSMMVVFVGIALTLIAAIIIVFFVKREGARRKSASTVETHG